MPEQAAKEVLLEKIKEKRLEINRFVSKAKPRHRRLINTAIIFGAIAAALTAGPALGGKSLTDWLNGMFGFTSPAWQLLCLGATVCSVIATIATNLSKQDETATQTINAQVCDKKLAGLEMFIETNQIDIDKASSQYVEFIQEIAFIGPEVV